MGDTASLSLREEHALRTGRWGERLDLRGMKWQENRASYSVFCPLDDQIKQNEMSECGKMRCSHARVEGKTRLNVSDQSRVYTDSVRCLRKKKPINTINNTAEIFLKAS
jgi:hypothetical protein